MTIVLSHKPCCKVNPQQLNGKEGIEKVLEKQGFDLWAKKNSASAELLLITNHNLMKKNKTT